jgi:tripartite-type tricarboxylate transporter receptor subunit TctC
MMLRRSLLAASLATPTLARPSFAQILPGGRPMRWVVPFPPGGAADAIARIWAEAVTARTGQAVVVENRGGANGILGVQAVTQAPGSVAGPTSAPC